jgi:hypothetical protein
MRWTEALDIIIARTGHERYRDLCADDNPDVVQRDAYRGLVVRLALGLPLEPTAAPDPATEQLQAHVAEHGCGGC